MSDDLEDEESEAGSSSAIMSTGRRRAVTGALLLGTFLSSIEVTVVGAAMPTIVEQLGGLALYPWVFSAYLLCQTITIPLYGRLADLYGRRPIYVAGVALFLVGSVLCGLASSMTTLVAARAVQGLGSGVVLPLTMTIFGDLYVAETRTKLQGLFSLVWGVSSVAGPLTGGAIVTHWSWHWVFWLNIPFGLLSGTVVGALLRGVESQQKRKLDVGGAALLAVATLLLLVALLPDEQRPFGLPITLWLGAALVAFLVFVAVERRHPEPMVPLGLFRQRVHLAVNGAGVLIGVALFGIISYVPLYIQGVRGGTPFHAGAALIPLSLGWSVASIVGGRVVRRVGFRLLVRVGCLLVAAGGGLGLLGLAIDSMIVAMGGLVVYGLGMGSCISSFTVSVQESVGASERGIATALSQFSRSIGGAVGVALLGAVLASVIGGVSSPGEVDSDLPPEQLDAGLQVVFRVAVGFVIAAAAVGLALFPKVAFTSGEREHR